MEPIVVCGGFGLLGLTWIWREAARHHGPARTAWLLRMLLVLAFLLILLGGLAYVFWPMLHIMFYQID